MALGFGTVVLALAPRWAGTSVYVLVASSVVVQLFGALVSGLGWLQHLSLFSSMALAPADDPVPSTLLLTAAIGVALALLGTVLFARRDLQTT